MLIFYHLLIVDNRTWFGSSVDCLFDIDTDSSEGDRRIEIDVQHGHRKEDYNKKSTKDDFP